MISSRIRRDGVGHSNVEGEGAVFVIVVRGRGVALFDAPAPVVGPGTASLVTAEGPCIASMTVWTIVGMSLEFKRVSIGVKEAGEETVVVDVLRLFNNWWIMTRVDQRQKVNQCLIGADSFSFCRDKKT